MLSDNIQKYRKQKGWSQEELAVRLNVVRQTISKWERGTSVPDADMLIQLSDLLGVSVSTLLGIEEKNWRADALAEELAAVNAELARRNRRTVLVKEAANKRNLILFLCFAALFIALAVREPVVIPRAHRRLCARGHRSFSIVIWRCSRAFPPMIFGSAYCG